MISSNAYAVEEYQILVCNSYCSEADKENLAITNRYARISEITVIDDNDWTAKTFKILDSSEPGQTIIDSWVISTPSEITAALNDIIALEGSLVSLSISSRKNAGIQNISPMTSVMATGAVAKREYNITIPSHRAESVTQMWDAGSYANVQQYIYGQLIWPTYITAVHNFIMRKSKTFVVIATFSDLSSINFEYYNEEGLLTPSFKKIDSTAQKDGKGYNPNRIPSSYEPSNSIEITQSLGSGSEFTYTSYRTCMNYTITSSNGSSWSGQACYWVYAN